VLIFIIGCFLFSCTGYAQPAQNGDGPRDKTLKLLFDRSISQLVDHSTYRITSRTRTALLPVLPSRDELDQNAEHFNGYLSRSLSENDLLKMIAPRDINKIIKKKNLTHTQLWDDTNAVKVGRTLRADILITGKLFKNGDSFELFLKMLRVKTGEVLSITKVNIDQDLGLQERLQ
jgi:hypothetical protein